MKWLETFFGLTVRGTTVATEVGAGLTTFLTMSYIIFVQPAVLSLCGMDFGAVMVATCLASGIACLLMAFIANYPIALAPAMGHNFFFALTVCGSVTTGGMGFHWQEGLAAVFLSGTLFLFLSFFGFREKIIEAIPEPLRYGLAVGIGLLVAFLGLQWGGIVVDAPGVLVGVGDVTSGPALLTFLGLFTTLGMMIRNVRGALFFGILLSTGVALATRLATFHGVAAAPPSLSPTLFALDLSALFANPNVWVAIAIFFMLDLFDTVGTLVALATTAGLLDADKKLPRAEKALAADAGGTVVGALLGTSTVTSYVESAAGIAVGGRTGLTALTTGLLFFLAIFFVPLAQTIGGGYEVTPGVFLYPIIAPALIVVGALMLKLVTEISWEDPTDYFPAYLVIVLTPLTVSITEGISAGFISYVLLKVVAGRFDELRFPTIFCALLFVARYIFL